MELILIWTTTTTSLDNSSHEAGRSWVIWDISAVSWSAHYMGAFLLDIYDLYYDSLPLYKYGVLKKRRNKNQDSFQALFSQNTGKYLFFTLRIVHIFFLFVFVTHWLEFIDLHVLLSIFCLSFWVLSASSSGVICVLGSLLGLSTGWWQTSQEG